MARGAAQKQARSTPASSGRRRSRGASRAHDNARLPVRSYSNTQWDGRREMISQLYSVERVPVAELLHRLRDTGFQVKYVISFELLALDPAANLVKVHSLGLFGLFSILSVMVWPVRSLAAQVWTYLSRLMYKKAALILLTSLPDGCFLLSHTPLSSSFCLFLALISSS